MASYIAHTVEFIDVDGVMTEFRCPTAASCSIFSRFAGYAFSSSGLCISPQNNFIGSIDSHGYMLIKRRNPQGQWQGYIHRFVAALFRPEGNSQGTWHGYNHY